MSLVGGGGAIQGFALWNPGIEKLVSRSSGDTNLCVQYSQLLRFLRCVVELGKLLEVNLAHYLPL